ncbi:hypothetical protein APSETT444_004159 [Aspergillus pseudonomiae]
MSFGGGIKKLRALPGDPQLVEYASVEAPPEIRPFSALSIPNCVTDLGNLFTWGPFDCLHDPQYSASLNSGAGLSCLDTFCQQSTHPFESPPVLQSPRPGTPIEPATLQSLPTPTEEIHQSSQTASHVLNDPIASSSISPRGDPDSNSDYDILIAENFFHVRAVRNETYEQIQSFYLAQTETCFKRYTSLRDILAYTGWLVTNAESIAAGKRIAQVMEKDTEGARKCVIHAGAIIRETRGVLTPACYQGFSLLFAFLYLWVYERFCTSTTTKWLRSDHSSSHRLLRIDRGLDSALEQQWIAGNPDCRPYLTGVGLLLEPGASTRLLRECQRILKSYDAWPHLRAGFILALNELVEEVNPLTDAPYSWAS